MKTLFLLFLLNIFLLFYSFETTESHTRNDLKLLRDIICAWETRGQKYPNNAISRRFVRESDKKIVGGAWGICQVTYDTALLVGFTLARSPGDLFLEEVNKKFSLKIIKRCRRLLTLNSIFPTVQRIAHCYGTGFITAYPKSMYAKNIAIKYAIAILERQSRRHELVEELKSLL